MNEEYSPSELKIDVANALPGIGDRKRLVGGLSAVVEGGYDLAFIPGGDIAWDVEIRRIAGGVAVTGSISGTVTLHCYRCLESFSHPFSLTVREHALWLSNGEVEDEEELVEEYVVDDGVLDLMPVFRDAICLAFPIQRVCREECRGLCKACGANLNVEECGCDLKVVDTRLSPLAELKKRMEAERE